MARERKDLESEHPSQYHSGMDIVQVGEAVLRGRSRRLERDEIRSHRIQELIAQMRETMRKAPGVGLAAPQIGVPLSVAVIEDKAEYMKDISEQVLAARGRRPVPFHVIINPVLTLHPGTTVEFFEGCLSLPGFTAIVRRAQEVRVECLDQHGEPQVIEASGWYARILQHEIDHLNGTLYIDRMLPRSFSSVENHAKNWKDRSIEEIKRELNVEG
ncbi:MAG: peptide deformylase [Bryobacteraceae bacterium]